ncbi:hypothetical protein EW146_g318 [Bondarzewia mesenterica]|uniref:NADP-dependent oxidoreductase domain-containing protein n=1 Tax=Bondarzewia mesenterica TaxID=1095465 RepID=A0A4S4MDT3_9AGAM|nr:hypothetical protein EW146_g318 [Bondarzewia mesenterica]
MTCSLFYGARQPEPDHPHRPALTFPSLSLSSPQARSTSTSLASTHSTSISITILTAAADGQRGTSTSMALTQNSTSLTLGFSTGITLYHKDVMDMAAAAIKAGFTHLDSTQAYDNEDSLSVSIIASEKPRSELFITTELYMLNVGTIVHESL